MVSDAMVIMAVAVIATYLFMWRNKEYKVIGGVMMLAIGLLSEGITSGSAEAIFGLVPIGIGLIGIVHGGFKMIIDEKHYKEERKSKWGKR